MVNYSEWLKDINDDTNISKLSIPGTHNAPACYSLAAPSVQCQGESVYEQLKNGIRFLDIRLSKNFIPFATDENDLIAVHGNFPVKLTGAVKFTSVLDEIYKFLDEHKSETVIVSIKQEGNGEWDNQNDEFPKVFNDHYLSKNKDKWYLRQELPKLRDARGKIILFRRFGVQEQDKQDDYGIPAASWSYNTTHDERGNICVQDFCELKTGADIPTKAGYVKDLINKAKEYNSTNSDPKLFVNFCSASNFFDTGCWPSAVSDGIKEAKVYESYGKGCGIIVLDFAERDNWKMARELIDKNF